MTDFKAGDLVLNKASLETGLLLKMSQVHISKTSWNDSDKAWKGFGHVEILEWLVVSARGNKEIWVDDNLELLQRPGDTQEEALGFHSS